MAVYILEPNLSDDFVVDFFTNMVLWETKKLIGLDMEHQEGCQTGYVECVANLFGESNDETIIKAFDKGETWLQVVNTIMTEPRLSVFINDKAEAVRGEGLGDDDLMMIELITTEVVAEYLLSNVAFARKAIRNI